MIITVEFLKKFIATDIVDEVLEVKLQALEAAIRKYTNNNFQNANVRFLADISNGVVNQNSLYLAVDDTIQISQSDFNKGLYTIVEKNDYQMKLDKVLYDEKMVLVTKIEYPIDVKLGVVDIMRWKLKYENQNYNPEAEKDIQSETISRHSVTYATDTTESDLDVNFGVPKKYLAFLKPYMKARF